MSLHTSLRQAKGKQSALRNVLKRHERVRYLMGKGLWSEKQSILGLPKIKPEKTKARKAAPKEAAAAEGTSASTPPSGKE